MTAQSAAELATELEQKEDLRMFSFKPSRGAVGAHSSVLVLARVYCEVGSFFFGLT